MSQLDTITRKELVAECGGKVSEKTIANREKEWGLDACRLPYCRRPVLYARVKALLIFKGLMLCE